MDYSRYLVLYSGGVDSTYFIEQESTATHLIHYKGLNDAQTKVAVVNANILNRYITLVPQVGPPTRDGETNQIHALYDAHMALDAGIRALSFGMDGMVMCFNAEDIGIQSSAIEAILQRANPQFKLLFPLAGLSSADIRARMERSQLKTISCMYSDNCGFCPKCLKS